MEAGASPSTVPEGNEHGDLTERHKEGEEKGVERNVGGVGRGIVDRPRARPQGSAAGPPTPKVFSYGIHFNMGPRKS